MAPGPGPGRRVIGPAGAGGGVPAGSWNLGQVVNLAGVRFTLLRRPDLSVLLVTFKDLDPLQ